ncbi:MAG TPA: MG2 domain-containing protein [Luteolibacter sp.]|nr:MG2 domain-containing protein [Luteolibacter sp.]
MAPTESVRRAFLFTDRSLYRPGETVRLKGVVRTQAGNTIQPAIASPARIVIIDPSDKEIFTAPVTLSDTGSFDLTYTLPADKTGTHLIRLQFPEELAKAEELEEEWEQQEAIRASASFEIELPVEEFRRNAFEIEQSIAKPANGATNVSSDLSATYYQGQPVAAGKVNYYTRITPKNPYPDRFRDFLFGNHRTADWSYWYHYFGYRSRYDDEDGGSQEAGPSNTQGEATLSPEGKVVISSEVPKAEFPTSSEVRISTEVTDSNNQTLTSSATTTVHPAELYIGVSRVDQLVRAGENVPLRLVAVDTEGNPYPNPVSVSATLTRQVNKSVRSQNENGDTVTRNDSAEETVLVSEVSIDPADSAKEGKALPFAPKQNGTHYLTLRGKDADGREFATVTSFEVYGAEDYPWLYEDGMRVKLIAEKKSYKAGETARVLVLSPIEGTALVTVEREKVLRSFLTPLKADKPIIEIPIGADDAPNAYVSVLIVKGAAESAREFKEPQLRLGYCELTIENERDKLAVSLAAGGPENDTFTVSTGPQAGKQLPACRPGETVTLTGTVTLADGKPAAGAELTLYAEDEGTLAVMGYETPDPLAFFYDPRVLSIEAGVSFNNFLTENPEYRNFYNKGFFIGGGADLGELAELYRKNFDPCATWAPVVKAGPDGKFTHTFKVPDTLTRYRVIAIAHQAEKFGNAESAIVVNKPLMLEPKTARFANQGDKFSPQVLVQNASPHNGTWEVTFSTGRGSETPTCRALGDLTQTVTLNAGASATLAFPVIAESTGESVFSWKATPVSLGNQQLTPPLTRSLSDAVEAKFEVQYPMPLIRQVKFVKVEGRQNLLGQIDPALLSGTGDVTLEFSRSPLTEISGSVDYLLSYPHGCVEQTTSSLMPWFAVNSLRSVVPAFAKVPEEKTKIAIQKGADRLLSMQLPDGSFTYWPGAKERVDWATSYAGLGLILAKKNGANVPESAIDSLCNHLTESLRGIADVKSSSKLEEHARGLWILALAEKPQSAYQSVLLDRIADLTPGARAFLALAFHASGEAPATAKAVLTSKTPLRIKPDGWMRWDADDSLKLLAWASIDPASKETLTAVDRLIHDRNPYGHWNTTWVNGWSLLAMATYAENQKTTADTWTAEFTKPLPGGTVTLTAENPTASATVKITPDLALDINPSGVGYVRIKVAAKPKIEPIAPVATNGLSVDRIYERIKADGSAEILTEPKLGDLIRVSLRVTLPNDNTKYLVIEDMLPSVFETVNTEFKTQGTGTGVATSANDWSVSHSELRTDRAVFYLDQIWRRGTYTLTYLARCTVPGEAMAPPAKVEGMYDPEFYALSASRVFSTK